MDSSAPVVDGLDTPPYAVLGGTRERAGVGLQLQHLEPVCVPDRVGEPPPAVFGGTGDVLVRGDEGTASGRQCREACSSHSEGFPQETVKGRAYELFFVFCFFS